MALKSNEIGKRREQVTIYKVEVLRDPGGGTDTVESEYWKTWAYVYQIKGTRVAETFQDSLKKVYSVTLRWRSDKEIDNAMKVEIHGVKTAIHSIDNVGFGDKYIELITVVD